MKNIFFNLQILEVHKSPKLKHCNTPQNMLATFFHKEKFICSKIVDQLSTFKCVVKVITKK